MRISDLSSDVCSSNLAENVVRVGCEHVVLSDEAVGPDRVDVPMILATGAVHTHLIRQKLRTFVSLNVRSGECLDVHYFAVLIGVGATTVNAYLAQESIAERPRRGLFGDRLLEACVPSSAAGRRVGKRVCS